MVYPQYRYSTQPTLYSPNTWQPQAVVAPLQMPGMGAAEPTGMPPSDEAGHRIPMSYKLLSVYAGCLGVGIELTYEAIIGFEAACTIASAEGMINNIEKGLLDEDRQSLFGRAEVLRVDTHHSGVYTRCLRLIYRMVYSYKTECVQDWQAIARNIDLNRDVFRSGEYEALVRLLHDYSSEIENAVYRANGQDELCTVNSRTIDYVSYGYLKKLAEALHGDTTSQRMMRSFFSTKAEEAFRQGYITGSQWEQLRAIAEDKGKPEDAGVRRMSLQD